MEERPQNTYLIPANTKKSQLILGFFTLKDLIIFIVGCAWSLLMLLFAFDSSIGVLIILLLPALISTFLVLPVPHYHNVLQLITNIWNYLTKNKKYYWKGWSIYEKFGRDEK